MIVHMLEFRVVPGREAEVAAFLRRPPPVDGHSNDAPVTCTGRRLGREQSEYILATVWPDDSTFERRLDPAGLPPYLAPMVGLLVAAGSLAFNVLAAHWENAFDGSRILRVYRGSVRLSGLDEWCGRVDVRAPALSANAGLRAVLIGTVIPTGANESGEAGAPDSVPVMAISAWSDWNAVLAATGGHIDQPVLQTEVEPLETSSSIGHYQILDSEATPAGR